VVIPAWNAARFIARAVDSVRAQSFGDVEIVMVNDGSPDGRDLHNVLARYARDPRVRCLEQENGGPSAARNAGIAAARADRIAFLDADDWWEPAYLARQLDLLDRGHDLVYCDARIVGDSLLAGRTYMDVTPSTEPVTFEKLVTLSCNIPTTCAMGRREAMVRAGGFDPSFRRCEDFDVWMRMSAAGARIAFSRDVLAAHHMHEASASADGAKMFESQIQVYEKIAALLGPSHPSTPVVVGQRQRAAADLALERSKQHLRARRYREAAGALDSAREVYRSPKLTAAAIGLRTAPGLLRLVDALRRRRRDAVPG
jgi:GT2 family glycosyltransferase